MRISNLASFGANCSDVWNETSWAWGFWIRPSSWTHFLARHGWTIYASASLRPLFNEELIHNMGVTATLLLDHCRQGQMEPNLKRGKTNLTPAFRGPRSRDMRRKFFSTTAGARFPVVCGDGVHHISVVSRYVHLGGVIHHRHVTKAEIKLRLSIAHGAFAQHRKLLYRNSNIPWIKRVELFQTLILSKLAYGLETWTFACQRGRSQFHAGVMRLYRRLYGGAHDEHLRDEDVLLKQGSPCLLNCFVEPDCDT